MISKTIIDFKPISPQHGDLFKGRNPVDIARQLEKAGVLGLSVVTAKEHFGGSLDLLRSIAKAVSLPVLRKDFIKSENDLYETRECGAKGVLLICATTENIGALHEKALSLGLKPVVEVHTPKEMKLAESINAKIIGINNKNITVLEKDDGTVEHTLELIKTAPKGTYIISESGISCKEDAEKVLKAGANAVLIGTAFWQGKIIYASL
ncbi:MAG: indole-3-glycerol-phosphate synthase [Alphaproteobacteria bacterium]|nr:indole-3-glycerol-phosphate synthase [Alphaproteobacteria bacterium]MCL2505439.1 indole-3-glycerol-phosphate synthase [Alphaproteobacteria bacterium]